MIISDYITTNILRICFCNTKKNRINVSITRIGGNRSNRLTLVKHANHWTIENSDGMYFDLFPNNSIVEYKWGRKHKKFVVANPQK